MTRTLSLTLLLAALGACAADSGPVPGEDLGITCSGKCDGLGGTIRSLWRDVSGIDTGDLTSAGVGLATDELNDTLVAGGLGAEFDAPVVFALDEDIDDRRTETLHSLDELVTGLGTRFGEGELSTRVNEVRARHLRESGDRYFAESAFRLHGDLSWGASVGGFADGASVHVGLAAGQVEARVVQAFDRELEANTRTMLGAFRESRGFVLPRDVADVRAMRPGELVALHGNGWVGLNLGAGVPVLIAEPTSAVTYHVVVSAALRAQLEGQLDIQLVRLDGDEAVVDVGTERATLRSASIAVRDGWGVSGLAESHVDVAGHSIDLGRLLDNALRRQLDRKLNLVDADAGSTTRRSRISVARFRFHLDSGAPELEAALSLALRGDLRLAQYLAQRGDSGVRQDFDLLRSGLSSASNAGIEIFGMRFFAESIHREGSVVVQTPGGAQSLLFDSHESRRGAFFSSHGYARVDLAGLSFDAATGQVQGDTNLYLQAVEGDLWMQRDKLLDHLDALILALAGPDAFARLERIGNHLQRQVQGACRSEAFNPCYTEVLGDPAVVELRAMGRAALESGLPPGLSPAQRELVLAAGDLRLTAQATFEPAASLVGPNTAIFVDARFSDDALAQLLATDDEDVRRALSSYVAAVDIRRGDSDDEIEAARRRILADEAGDIDDVVADVAEARDRFEQLQGVETARIDGLGLIGPNAVEVRIPVVDGRVVYEQAVARSFAQARSEVVRQMFDAMLDDADHISGVTPEQAVLYTLLSLTPAQQADVRLDIDMKLDDRASQDYAQYRAAGYAPMDHYARGDRVDLIAGGLFDVDALLRIEDL